MSANTTKLGRATYSPEDNKLRFYPDGRLSKEDYELIRGTGFIWAPKQELFVASAWSPHREDLLLAWAGEIEDEDKSLTERAEERAERFEDYSERRAEDSSRATEAVKAIADGIPLGQPILVGHHSQRRAEKDAEKIQAGMTRAVKLWETSKYWMQRAAGAKAHARYKELPAVRARRIKTIEADLRKRERQLKEARSNLLMWQQDDLTHERATYYTGRGVGNFYLPRKEGDRPDFAQNPCAWTALKGDHPTLYAPRSFEEVREHALRHFPKQIAYIERWTAHYQNRLSYERSMLEADGGLLTDKVGPEVGGAISGLWAPRGGWAYIRKVNKVTVTVYHRWNSDGGRFFAKNVDLTKVRGIMSKAQVEQARSEGRLIEVPDVGFQLLQDTPAPEPKPYVPPPAPPEEIVAMKASLREGVKAVSANQLFPTPPAIAKRLVALAGSTLAGCRVLEPSAGTGNLVRAIWNSATGADCVRVVAVEMSQELAKGLVSLRGMTVHANEGNTAVVCADFLECSPEERTGTFTGQWLATGNPGDHTKLGKFNVVIMNPPFENGSDIRHVKHALTFLKDGGILVGICANGPRQTEDLLPLCDHWEPLPEGTFAGTGVRTVLFRIQP